MEIDRYRDQFPHIAEGYVHLNHAGVSGLSAHSVSRMTEAIYRQSHDPIGFFPYAMEHAIKCRQRLADLMGVNAEHLAFTKNTAHGVSIIADGFDWREQDEVVFADSEYPANSYPWLAQRDRGVVCKIVPTRPDGTVPVTDYAAALTIRTRIIAVSWVQFSTGYRVDLREMAKLAHSHGALLVADVIQGLGAFPLNLSELGVDAAATGSQKWLIGPVGVGGLYIHPKMLPHLRLVNMGAGAVKNVSAFDTIDFDPKPTAQRYEEGTPNLFGYFGLEAALEMLSEIGMGMVSQRILNITRYAMQGLQSRGYIIDSPVLDDIRSGIVMFHHMKHTPNQIVEALKARKVHNVQRGGRVRFAPHFYTTEKDIDRAIDALP
jgi:selenocysteine lyase/cysteine desulfurase